MIKSGSRFASQVCQTEVIVVRSTDSFDDLRCGGIAMVPMGEAPTSDARIVPEFSGGSVMGKRYVDDSGAEVLVTKPGAGSLSSGTTPLDLKEAKPLPASD